MQEDGCPLQPEPPQGDLSLNSQPECLRYADVEPAGTFSRLTDTGDQNLDVLDTSDALAYADDASAAVETWSRALRLRGRLILRLPEFTLCDAAVWPLVSDPRRTNSFSSVVSRRTVGRTNHFHVWTDLASLLSHHGLNLSELSFDDSTLAFVRTDLRRPRRLRITAVRNELPSSPQRIRRPRWYRDHISVPEPMAFNGTVTHTPLGPLLVYRPTDSSIATVLLDRRRRPIDGTRTLLPLHGNADPRVVRHEGDMYLTTSWGGGAYERIELRRLRIDTDGIASVTDVGKFKEIDCDLRYKRVREKNWTPWSLSGSLNFTHMLSPHRVLQTDLTTGRVRLVAETRWRAPWWRSEWGLEFRLNTPPVRISDVLWLSVFHTVGELGYYSGFYTYEGFWPYRVRQLSLSPVFFPGDATGSNPRTGARCLFFVGMDVDRSTGEVRLFGGDNDCRIITVTANVDEVLAHLHPVIQISNDCPPH